MPTTPETAPARASSGCVRSLVERLGDGYDDARWAPHNVADAVLGLWWAHERKVCGKDPQWAAIEARRRRGSAGAVTLFSEEDNLGWAEYNTQHEIERRMVPTPWWVGVVRTVKNRPLRRTVGQVRHRVQRARRGWSNADLWNLDSYLCETLSAQLRQLADEACGWPAGEEFPQFEDWQEALRSNAQALAGWHGDPDTSRELSAAIDSGDEDRIAAASAANMAAEQAKAERAQQAMHWVADHLGNLWD